MGVFASFSEKSCNSAKNDTVKKFGRHEMKIQEASGDITSWGNSVPSPKTKEDKVNFKKTKKKAKLAQEKEATHETRAPGA
jgi:hypothetical protein